MHHLPGSAQTATTSHTSGECHKTSISALANSSRHCVLPTERARAGPWRDFSPFLKGSCWGRVAPGSPSVWAAHTASLHWGRAAGPSTHPCSDWGGAAIAQIVSASFAALKRHYWLLCCAPLSGMLCLILMHASLARRKHFVYLLKEDSLVCFFPDLVYLCVVYPA